MLKIEVIKFEAQDIITTSGTPVVEDTPVAPKEDKCICSPNDKHYKFETWDDSSIYYDHGDCTYEGTHNCREYEVIS